MTEQLEYLKKVLREIEQERTRSDADRQRITTLESDHKHMLKDLSVVALRLDALIEEQKKTNEVLTRWKGISAGIVLITSLFWSLGLTAYKIFSKG